MESYFTAFSYDTPEETRRYLLNRLLFGSNLGFYIGFIRIVLKSRSEVLKGIYDDKAWAESSMDIFNLIQGHRGRFHITGIDNFRNFKKPLVFISNHMSTLETLIFPCLIVPYKPVTFVVKEQLLKMPFFGPIIRSRDPITVGRKNPKKDLNAVLTRGEQMLTQGKSIVIFPQSTREPVFNPERFNSLGIKLAKKAGVSCIPVAIKTDFWGNGKIISNFGKIDYKKPIHIAFGKPFVITGRGKKEHQKIVEFIQSNLQKWNKG